MTQETASVAAQRVRGTVKWFNNGKGYGFLGRADAIDVFVHYSAIQSEGYKSLAEGDAVEFEVVDTAKGQEAREVVLIKGSSAGGGRR